MFRLIKYIPGSFQIFVIKYQNKKHPLIGFQSPEQLCDSSQLNYSEHPPPCETIHINHFTEHLNQHIQAFPKGFYPAFKLMITYLTLISC